jgi:hypothetical protein
MTLHDYYTSMPGKMLMIRITRESLTESLPGAGGPRPSLLNPGVSDPSPRLPARLSTSDSESTWQAGRRLNWRPSSSISSWLFKRRQLR